MTTNPEHLPPPKILSNKDHNADTVHVTYALPGLRRATVSVPRKSWLEGRHARVGHHLTAMLDEINLTRRKP